MQEYLEESDRGELVCPCGCARTWLVSRGKVQHSGVITSFVAIPTIHGDERVSWLALGRGAQPNEWACVCTRLAGDNIAAGVVDPDNSLISKVFAGAKLQPRERVVADAAGKQRLFQAHDALLRNHPDLQQLFVPERGRDYSFMMPDCVFALPPAKRSPRNQQNFAECDDRLFVRALLPVPISDGGELRVGIWIEVPRQEFFALMEVWDVPDAYIAARLTGQVESSLRVAGNQLAGVSVTLAPRTADQCLFVDDSESLWLARLLRAGVSVRVLPQIVGEIERSIRSKST